MSRDSLCHNALMAARHRKTLVVCGSCHADIHSKKPVAALTE